jgi:hypothetical protein
MAKQKSAYGPKIEYKAQGQEQEQEQEQEQAYNYSTRCSVPGSDGLDHSRSVTAVPSSA